MRWPVVIALALMPLACNRAADEPRAAAGITAASTADVTSATTKRCIVPTPPEAPPPVPRGPARGCPVDPSPHTLATTTMHFPESDRGGTELTVEIARTPADTERGLMFRTSMADDHGMFFDLGSHKVQSFWMRNTCIPLDMIFVDEDGFVVGVVENVPTLNVEPRGVPCPSSYVVEVNAGWSRRHGVRAGQRVALPGA